MKTLRPALSLLFLALFVSAPLFAAEIQPEGTALRKMQRGFLNVALSPIDIVHELEKEKRHDTFPPSWLLGLGRGMMFTAGRALTGVYEMVTFPIPLPSGYEPILQPEFPWQHLEESTAKEFSAASSTILVS